ncbi:GIY-YIG nuclease family protein [Chitinophaga sp. LS1]|uniref:GIY-YIG nuclease family protein n=1 Tax=Chitinophaga sp. LS1 TaxID=3051176 RepID=UPI002AABE2EA|nr:GIY-YIG nuclease family protein [Chitinophaga sp. LS1]WPV65957.1 GIY-YIG nuclease family protein [Chitinophaga sp. LS1]
MNTVSGSRITIKDQFNEIDQAISNEAARLRQLSGELVFENVIEFELNNNIPPIAEYLMHRKGVYFFQIKNKDLSLDVLSWVTTFTQLWKDADVIWVPGIKKARVNAHRSFDEWIPLYIGKSKNVGGRITEHIHQVKDRRTFSMKLKARANLHGEVLRVSWIPLDIVNYDMIAPAIESMLRERINPITGKQ